MHEHHQTNERSHLKALWFEKLMGIGGERDWERLSGTIFLPPPPHSLHVQTSPHVSTSQFSQASKLMKL